MELISKSEFGNVARGKTISSFYEREMEPNKTFVHIYTLVHNQSLPRNKLYQLSCFNKTLTPSSKAKANSTSIELWNENIEMSINLPGNIQALRVAGGSL